MRPEFPLLRTLIVVNEHLDTFPVRSDSAKSSRMPFGTEFSLDRIIEFQAPEQSLGVNKRVPIDQFLRRLGFWTIRWPSVTFKFLVIFPLNTSENRKWHIGSLGHCIPLLPLPVPVKSFQLFGDWILLSYSQSSSECLLIYQRHFPYCTRHAVLLKTRRRTKAGGGSRRRVMVRKRLTEYKPISGGFS